MNNKLKLLPERHPNRDFFVADIFDNIPLKDDIASMEHPIFSLATKKDLRVIKYEHNDSSIVISPNAEYGLPTIFDKDILLYCGSILMNEINSGRTPSKKIRISTHDLLVATNRSTGGEGYKLFKNALDRLTSVYIDTNIKTGGKEESRGFHLIEDYKIIESSKVQNRMVRLELTLSDWFYNSVIGKEVLTISRKYFRLRQALERRIYEIARKHCGRQDFFRMSLKLLHKKTGSTSTLSKFRFNINKIIEKNVFPDYQIKMENDDVSFIRIKNTKEGVGESNGKNRIVEKVDLLNKAPVNNNSLSFILKTSTMEKARDIALKAKTGWDIYAIKEEFEEFNKENTEIKDVDAYFLGFVRKKVKNCP